jgi:hypothetical protein
MIGFLKWLWRLYKMGWSIEPIYQLIAVDKRWRPVGDALPWTAAGFPPEYLLIPERIEGREIPPSEMPLKTISLRKYVQSGQATTARGVILVLYRDVGVHS